MSKSQTAPAASNEPKQDAAEHREHPRRELTVDVTLQSEHNFYTGCSQNISAGGLFVATHEPHAIGDLVAIELTLPGLERRIHANGRVRWLRPYQESNDAPAGIGIAFVGLSEMDSSIIDGFILERSPILFE